MVAGGYSSQEVKTSSDICNYNWQVTGFPG